MSTFFFQVTRSNWENIIAYHSARDGTTFKNGFSGTAAQPAYITTWALSHSVFRTQLDSLEGACFEFLVLLKEVAQKMDIDPSEILGAIHSAQLSTHSDWLNLLVLLCCSNSQVAEELEVKVTPRPPNGAFRILLTFCSFFRLEQKSIKKRGVLRYYNWIFIYIMRINEVSSVSPWEWGYTVIY